MVEPLAGPPKGPDAGVPARSGGEPSPRGNGSDGTAGRPAASPRVSWAGLGERLPMGVKLAYGMPNFAGAAMAIPIAIHMSIFYSDVVLVPLGTIALAVAVARAFDAITDPFMGWVTDRTRSRFGRRIPWMFIGAPLCALAFFLLFTPPEDLSARAAGAWFLVTFTLYYLFHTVYVIPHYGLGPELTQDYKERSSLFAVGEGFTLLGTMCAAALPGLVLIPRFGARTGFMIFSLVFGSLLAVLYLRLCLRIRERPEFFQRKSNPLVPGLRRMMRNRPFRILLASYVVGSVTGAIPGLMMPYFTTYVLKPENPDQWIGIFLLTYFGMGFLTLPLWLRAVRRFGKKPIYVIGGGMGVFASLSLFFMGEGDLAATFGILVFAGAAFGVRIFLGPSIQGDVIDYDELYTGRRREAQYGSLWAIMTKFTVIPSAAIPLAILASLGYQPNVEQSETVELAIRAIFGLGPMTFGVLSLLAFLPFPITERTHRAVLSGIDAHRRGESAEDPLTGRVLPPPSMRGVDEDVGWFLDHFSGRELGRYLEHDAAALRESALRRALVALGLFGGAIALVVTQVRDLGQEPGFVAVLGVVVAGLAMTAVVDHGMRVAAARRMARAPVSREVVRAHLDAARDFAQSRRR
jgi:glycoside/pentoside/hexuronide:cation symporter, GPH family